MLAHEEIADDESRVFYIEAFSLDSWVIVLICYAWGNLGLGAVLFGAELAVSHWLARSVVVRMEAGIARVLVKKRWPGREGGISLSVEAPRLSYWTTAFGRGFLLAGRGASLRAATRGNWGWAPPSTMPSIVVSAPVALGAGAALRNTPNLALGIACLYSAAALHGGVSGWLYLVGSLETIKSLIWTFRGVPSLVLSGEATT